MVYSWAGSRPCHVDDGNHSYASLMAVVIFVVTVNLIPNHKPSVILTSQPWGLWLALSPMVGDVLHTERAVPIGYRTRGSFKR